MKLICHDDEGRKIYEDNDDWIWENNEKSKTSKKDNPLFPFFAIKMWRYKIDDKETFEKLKNDYETSMLM